MEKVEAIRLWIEEHHPALNFVSRGNHNYCMIEDPIKPNFSIEIDFYDEADAFYIYPKRGIRGVQILHTVHISDPSYFTKIDEMIDMARTIAVEPPEWNGRPLWTY